MEGMCARDMCKYAFVFLCCTRGTSESLSDHQVKLLTRFLCCSTPAWTEEAIKSGNNGVSNTGTMFQNVNDNAIEK